MGTEKKGIKIVSALYKAGGDRRIRPQCIILTLSQDGGICLDIRRSAYTEEHREAKGCEIGLSESTELTIL